MDFIRFKKGSHSKTMLNRLNDLSIIFIGSIVGVCVLVGIVSQCFLKPDNPIEEAAEEVIKAETGLDIDLSPSTPEKN